MASGVLKTSSIIDAFKTIDRKHFVPKTFIKEAYADIPLGIGNGQTISQPYTVAFMLEKLHLKKGDKVLDIGSGSGWTTALLAYIVGDTGSVLGVERVPELVMIGLQNLTKLDFKHAHIELAHATLGIEGEKFDAILVSASAKEIPYELFKQLNIEGHLVIPIQNSIFVFKKVSEEKIETKEFPGFRFVPLIV